MLKAMLAELFPRKKAEHATPAPETRNATSSEMPSPGIPPFSFGRVHTQTLASALLEMVTLQAADPPEPPGDEFFSNGKNTLPVRSGITIFQCTSAF